jgi:putative membrane protein
MRSYLAQLVLSALTLIGTAYLLPGFKISGPVAAVFAAFVIGVANVLIRPALLLLTLPLNILTLGLFTWVVNAAVLKICAALAPGFEIEGWGSALLGALLIAIISTFVFWLFGPTAGVPA